MSLADMKQVARNGSAAPTLEVNGSAAAAAAAAAATAQLPTAAAVSPLRRGSFGRLATPEEFVREYGGKRTINKILIANNGIAGEKL
jgi:hypothetical protein